VLFTPRNEGLFPYPLKIIPIRFNRQVRKKERDKRRRKKKEKLKKKEYIKLRRHNFVYSATHGVENKSAYQLIKY
jgi:hypothetical protein